MYALPARDTIAAVVSASLYVGMEGCNNAPKYSYSDRRSITLAADVKFCPRAERDAS